MLLLGLWVSGVVVRYVWWMLCCLCVWLVFRLV